MNLGTWNHGTLEPWNRAVSMPNSFAIEPPVEPMLAKLTDEVPVGEFLYEPKWDGFRALIFLRQFRRVHPKPRLAAAGSVFS